MYRPILNWLSSLLLALSVSSNESPTIRQTTNGPIEGVEETSSLGLKYYAFRGIPFAEPPITGTDPYTGEEVDRRFKVRYKKIIESFLFSGKIPVLDNVAF